MLFVKPKRRERSSGIQRVCSQKNNLYISSESDREIFNLKKNNTQIETAEVSSALKTRYPLC